jgi:hypothetical protein
MLKDETFIDSHEIVGKLTRTSKDLFLTHMQALEIPSRLPNAQSCS